MSHIFCFLLGYACALLLEDLFRALDDARALRLDDWATLRTSEPGYRRLR